MKFLHRYAVVAAWISFGATIARGQAADARRAVIQAVIQAIHASNPSVARIAVDERVFERSHEATSQTHADLAQIVGSDAKLQIVHRSDVYSCNSARPDSCALLGVGMLVTLGRPLVAGSTAVVDVEILSSSTSRRQPVATVVMRYRLTRQGVQWVIAGGEIVSRS